MRFKHRRNFLPALILACLFWTALTLVIFNTSPEEKFSLLVFFCTLFGALTLTLALLFGNTRRAFLLTLGVIIFLVFRLLEMANTLNLILLFGTLLSLEIYFSRG
jgi:hypothetical protein